MNSTELTDRVRKGLREGLGDFSHCVRQPDIWKLLEALALAEARVEELEDALRGVIRVADRKTREFDAARAALGDTQ